MSIRAVIVDDEPLARERLRDLLKAYPDVEIAGEYEESSKAIEAIEIIRPDVIFLDIQLPDGDGFDVVQSLNPQAMPHVVFVTAYDQYAIQAFEVHALDYLLKPVGAEHVHRALERVRSTSASPGKFFALLEGLQGGLQPMRRLLVKTEKGIFCLRPADIDWIEAAGNYTCIHADGKTHILRETLQSLAARWSSAGFAQASRSALVNLEKIRLLRPKLYGDYIIELMNGEKIPLSRGYREELLKRIERHQA